MELVFQLYANPGNSQMSLSSQRANRNAADIEPFVVIFSFSSSECKIPIIRFIQFTIPRDVHNLLEPEGLIEYLLI